MGGRIVLGPNRYGKAETRLVRVVRDTARHEVRDLTVSSALTGDFAAAHLEGDQAHVLPTDTQKNTVFAFAKRYGVGEPEEFAALLARHFVDDVEPVHTARVSVEEHAWQRIEDHDHAFTRGGPVRTAEVLAEAGGTTVVGGVRDLVLLKTTGSSFAGFLVDELTTLTGTDDRVLATSLTARWEYDADAVAGGVDWAGTHAGATRLLATRFADVHSLALQQSLAEMGRAVLEAHPWLLRVELVAPNLHHVAVDLAPFGLDNPGEVFHATDRPYGLIEVTMQREEG